MKKWRPLWSYDVEKTEQWLSHMASEGKQVTSFNRWTRMFSFQEGVFRKNIDYQLIYEKSDHVLPEVLKQSGWEVALTDGNWHVAENELDDVRVSPSREGVLKRNRLHTAVLTGISYLYAIQLLTFSIAMLTILFSFSMDNVEKSPLWILTFTYFAQVIVVIWIAIYSIRKLRAFERKYFDTGIDEEIIVGETFTKWKLGWFYAPDLVENWLSDMAAKGNHFVDIFGTRFRFERGTPKRVAYVHDLQWKTGPNYYDIHKSAGWRLKYSTRYTFMKHSLWMKEYEVGEEKPQFSYDKAEKKVQVRKVVLGNVAFTLLFAMLYGFILKTNFTLYQDIGWSTFGIIFVSFFVASFAIPGSILIQTVRYFFRMRRSELEES